MKEMTAGRGTKGAARAILSGGVIAGGLDILFAFLFYGLHNHLSPVRILQTVASGVLGKAAFSGGASSAALGAVFQLVIPIGAAAIYYAASRGVRVLIERPVLCGMLYGIVIYAVMNFVVVPLSAVPGRRSFPLVMVLPALLAHMFLIGLPIALCVRWYSAPQTIPLAERGTP